MGSTPVIASCGGWAWQAWFGKAGPYSVGHGTAGVDWLRWAPFGRVSRGRLGKAALGPVGPGMATQSSGGGVRAAPMTLRIVW